MIVLETIATTSIAADQDDINLWLGHDSALCFTWKSMRGGKPKFALCLLFLASHRCSTPRKSESDHHRSCARLSSAAATAPGMIRFHFPLSFSRWDIQDQSSPIFATSSSLKAFLAFVSTFSKAKTPRNRRSANRDQSHFRFRVSIFLK